MKKLITYILLIGCFFTFSSCGLTLTKTPVPNELDLQLLAEVQKDNIDIGRIKIVLEKGASPNAFDYTDYSVVKPISVLVALSLRAKDVKGGYITEQGLIEVLNLLIEKGLRLTILDYDVLFYPIANGCRQYVEILLHLGCSPTRPINGMSPVDIAVKYGYPEIADLLVKYVPKKALASDVTQ